MQAFNLYKQTMAEHIFEYVLIWILWLLSIFSFLIGFEQMIRVLISWYIINVICLFLSNAINILINALQYDLENTFLGLSFKTREGFFINGHTTIILIIYWLLLLLVFRHSKINITLPDHDLISNTIQVCLIPLTVFSIIFWLEVAIFWDKLISIVYMKSIALSITENIGIQRAITLTPVRITIHALITLRITTQIGIWIQKNTPQIGYE